jgi:hypothetical protein
MGNLDQAKHDGDTDATARTARDLMMADVHRSIYPQADGSQTERAEKSPAVPANIGVPRGVSAGIVDSLEKALPPMFGPEDARRWTNTFNDVEAGKWNGKVDLGGVKDQLSNALSSYMTNGEISPYNESLVRSGKLDVSQARAMTFEQSVNDKIQKMAAERGMPTNFRLRIELSGAAPDGSRTALSANLTQELGRRDYTDGTSLSQYGIKRRNAEDLGAYKPLAHVELGKFEGKR